MDTDTTLTAAPVVTDDQMALVKATVAKGATDVELKLYLYDCAQRNIHPLDKLLHFTKRKAKDGSYKYTPITSIDFMRSRAELTGSYAGNDDATFETANKDTNSQPKSATVTVYRIVQGVRCPFSATARWSEYKPDKDDFMWRKMPHTMLGKCAEALALRKGFPQSLAGLYAAEEMDQAGPATVVSVDDATGQPRPLPPQSYENPTPPTTAELAAMHPAGTVEIVPPGTVLIAEVEAWKTKTKKNAWTVTDGNGETYKIWENAKDNQNEWVDGATLSTAVMAAQQMQIPVLLDCKTDNQGRKTLVGVHKRRDDDPETEDDTARAQEIEDAQGPEPPLTEDDIPF